MSPSPPLLGLGTWDLRGKDCVRAVREALELGYRHIDTAQMYENEREVGRGLRDSRAAREAIFLTTKLWRDNLTRDRVARSVDESLRRLETDYVDLLLIHWPNEEVPLFETLDAMSDVRAKGKTRAIGVSNFPSAMWRRALERAPVHVNQIEYHPFLDQETLVSFARERSLQLVAYRPIAKGEVARDPTLAEIARAHARTAPQVALRWLIQKGVAAIPKAARRAHLEENLGALDFELGEAAMSTIDALGGNRRYIDPGWAPAWDAPHRRPS